ncbi:MAG: hypothetical protein JRI41_06895 [Deltaproteobacteria bacterium]|nr:hypothetical protein [Deltaproteobacteria bacterium]
MALRFATREEVAVGIVNAISTVSALQLVERQHQEITSNVSYPLAYVNEVREERTRLLKDVIKVSAQFAIVVADKSDDGSDMSTILNTLVASVAIALLEDLTLDSKVYNLKVSAIDTDEGFLAPYCVGVMTVRVDYYSQA